ncbi:hypothetical protein [Rhodohalobacter halophilus]|uniref:hypothetical protein n=1 Tax=Rhodohalobacter halophilus TaxID=1812810 RepID=UPI000A001826|nr:hypothetical protein [Rhodohalobacter halophilus]
MNSILILNLFSSFFLCGLIWTVQLVHYPFFLFAGNDRFKPSMDFHRSRISYIVIPVMLAELFSSAWLTFYSTDFTGLHTTGLLLILLVWGGHFFQAGSLTLQIVLRF